MLGQAFLAAPIGTVLHFNPLQHRLGLQELLYVARIVDAGKLDQKLGFSIAAPRGLNR